MGHAIGMAKLDPASPQLLDRRAAFGIPAGSHLLPQVLFAEYPADRRRGPSKAAASTPAKVVTAGATAGRLAAAILHAVLLVALPLAAHATTYAPSLFGELHWRMIGPFRGGRTVGAAGVPGQPNVFYIGVNNGGVWKTADYGRVWKPIFDSQPTGSIGSLAVAPSDPKTIYVGSGEGLQRPDLSVGDGIYRSRDAGATWTHLGLRNGQQIPAVIVDPRDPKRVFAAVLGHPYGPNAEGGVYRSTDGGESWTRVLFRDEDTGAMDVAFDPANAQTVYAVL